MQIALTPVSLKPLITIEYQEKRNHVTSQTLLNALTKRWFPFPASPTEWWTQDANLFQSWLDTDMEAKAYGDCVLEYTIQSDHYALHKVNIVNQRVLTEQCTLGNAKEDGFKEMHRRLQGLLLFFIEGASFIDELDERWHIYILYVVILFLIFDFLYSKTTAEFRYKKAGDGRVETMGFVTCYPFYVFPDKLRMRISQFILLPPFQAHGHGGIAFSKVFDGRSRVSILVQPLCSQ
jgi:hypothetical protein